MSKENLEVKEELKEEVKEEEKGEMVVSGFGALEQSAKSSRKYYTTIDLSEQKKLYNLDNADCDFLLNDCEGQSIRVVDVLIKEFTHELDEPKVNEETGEIQEFETNKACILVDDAGQTYATGSKMFTNQMKRFIVMYGVDTIKNGLEIKIVKKKMKDSGNKALAFELI